MNKKVTYGQVAGYLTYIVETYSDVIEAIDGKEINKDVMAVLKEFARVQDSIYARQYKKKCENNLADDLFEVLLATLKKDDFGADKSDAVRNTIMHDAWLLGKMFVIKGNKVKLQPNDNGIPFEKNEIEQVTETNFKKISGYNADECGKKPFSFTIHDKFGAKSFTFTFQWRRVFGKDPQVLHFADLSFEQQTLDNPPQFTYIAVISPRYKGIIRKFITSLKLGNKTNKTNETMKDSGKRVILANTNSKRIVYARA
jgi:hypothetical protein